MEYVIRVTTTGSAGAAAGTGSSESPVRGYLEAIQVAYTNQPATTDVTVSEVGGMARTLLTRTNSSTGGVFYPRAQASDSTGTAISGQYGRLYLSGATVTVSVAEGDAAGVVLVRMIVVEEGV
jgi:hypothetical protein